MNLIKTIIIIVITSFLFPSISHAFGKAKQVEQVKEKPTCTNVGQLQCPGKLKPTCPKQHKPSCVFVGTMQLPSCLADSADNTFFSYNLDKISCEK